MSFTCNNRRYAQVSLCITFYGSLESHRQVGYARANLSHAHLMACPRPFDISRVTDGEELTVAL